MSRAKEKKIKVLGLWIFFMILNKGVKGFGNFVMNLQNKRTREKRSVINDVEIYVFILT